MTKGWTKALVGMRKRAIQETFPKKAAEFVNRTDVRRGRERERQTNLRQQDDTVLARMGCQVDYMNFMELQDIHMEMCSKG